MKTKLTLIALAVLSGIMSVYAQTACPDWNGYVDSKNTNGTGYYTLINGFQEYAAQTYHYSGPGKITLVRVYGEYPFLGGGVPLRLSIYNVDANGRPTSTIQSQDFDWYSFDNAGEYKNISFGSGVNVSGNFAVGVSLRSGFPLGSAFRLKYTGDGEGLGEDLASLAGTSTGTNWTSAMNNFNRDGDFYIIPQMTNYVSASFEASAHCVSTSQVVSFSNSSEFTMDSMFNTIGLDGYTGSANYFTWNFGDGSPVSHATNPTHSYATAGVYTVSLTTSVDGWDGICSDVYTAQISVGLSVSTSSVSNALCYGSADGSVTASGNGGAEPYTFSLNGFLYEAEETFSGLAAGTYSLHVKDALGCISSTSFTVTQPSAIVISSSTTTNANCGSANGGILVTATGGSGALQYQLNSGAFQSSGSFGNLNSGSYTVTVKDANNCSVSVLVYVNNSGAPSLSILSTTNVSCNGGNDGSLVLTATGGTGTLQYSIDGGANFQTSGSFLSLEAGTYAVLVKDNAGCTNGFSVVISEPGSINFTVASSPVSCYDGSNGSVTVTSATGGIGTFSYSIDGDNYQSGTVFEGLSAGTYTVYLKDVASCISSQDIIVSEPALLVVTAVATPASCNGTRDGVINASGSGGAGGYSYSLDGDDFQPLGIFYNLSAGNYTVVIKDNNDCLSSVNVTVSQPTEIEATISTTNSTCGNSNGGFLITASGGSGTGYEYTIDGNNYNSNGSFSGLASGTYYILVKDNANCGWIFSATIIDSDGPSIGSASHTNVSCNGGADGTITVSGVTGGTGILEYSIDGTNWQTSSLFSGLSAGSYVVLVRDANGCIGTSSVVLTQPNPLTVSTIVDDANCFGDNSGSVTILASGGAGTLAYSINRGNTYQSDNYFDELYAGIYSVLIRDGAGCVTSIYFGVTQPTEMEITTGVLNVTCNGAEDGKIIVAANGGTGAIQYSIDANNFQSSHVFSNLSGGVYVVTAKDANGCRKSTVVTVNEPDPLVLYYEVSDVTCHEGNDGVIDLTVVGGTAPYSFDWSVFTIANTEDIFNLSAGEYSVTVTDANRCETYNSFTITQPSEPIIINGVVTNASGTLANNGAIDITVTGGEQPYTYSWSSGEDTEDLSNLVPGVYVVTITDLNGCTTMEFYIVDNETGISEANVIGQRISVYPNPASNFTVVEATGYTIESLLMMDALGQRVFAAQPMNTKVQIDLSNISQGTYFVQLLINDQLITKRVNVIK